MINAKNVIEEEFNSKLLWHAWNATPNTIKLAMESQMLSVTNATIKSKVRNKFILG